MVLGRSSLLAISLVFISAIANAENDGNAKAEVSLGLQAAAAKPESKPDTRVDVKSKAETKSKGNSESAATGINATDAQTVRRDPKGKKGISPFWEAIRRGDEAALARDFPKAEEAYQAALALDSKNPLAHFRRGQILVRAGKLPEAEVVYQDALRLSDQDATLHAAALFVLADLKERQGQRAAAIVAWKTYANYLKAEHKAKGYPETPIDRDQRLKKYDELVVSSKAVAERIQLRVKEVEEANRRAAAKNPNQSK